jgi:radical SAM protein with 4Fe4S-binding SPASM domain
MKHLFSAPTTLNLELTELCNARCRHCYNFWRDESMGSVTLDKETLDKIFDRIHDAGVFHVILSGGEPFAKFDLLEYAIRALTERGLSLSVNSNLMLATEERISRLRRLGLDHILTSLPSCDPATTDYIMAQVGAFERVTRGIRCTTRNGIRVSANMVVTRRNMSQVHATARLAADLGCERLFVTRSVPPTYAGKDTVQDYSLTPEETKAYLDEALRARDEFGIEVGSLVSYPLCFLGDLDRYSDFVGRGCPSQSGHRMSVNANGDVHACVHEEEAYGNVLESSIAEIYQGRMRRWHDGRFRYTGCAGCRYADVCESGCSMAALGIYGDHAAKDPLFVGPHAFTRHFQLAGNMALHDAIRAGMRFGAPERLRFRREDGFWLLNIRWGNSITIDNESADFLIDYQRTGNAFTLDDFGPDRCELLANLFCKDAVVAEDPSLAARFAGDRRQRITGLSINLEALEPA